jgi:hypothetical protein
MKNIYVMNGFREDEITMALFHFGVERIETIVEPMVEKDTSYIENFKKYKELYAIIQELCEENDMLDILFEMDVIAMGLASQKKYAAYWQGFRDSANETSKWIPAY